MSGSILIVEDESVLARNLARYLTRVGYETAVAETLARGRALYEELRPDVVLVDYNLPDGLGTDLIAQIRTGGDTTTKIVMSTAHGSVSVAVEAMKKGADDYLTKPIALDEVTLLVDRLLSQTRTEESLAYYRRQDERRSGLERIIGQSAAIVAMKQRISQLLAMESRQREGSPPAVLITGETGTGKELVARALHFDGPRRGAPFIEINCAALPGHLIESELFGHEKGAFTDAKERRTGLVQAADRGTLFLDEIGELPLAAQAKLLKVLEDQRIRPVGSTRERKVDLRFVAATNATLEDRVRSGEFRADLFYRLAAFTIATPPLNQRGEDILLLAEHFLAEHKRRYDRPAIEISPEAAAALRAHAWPGNVRELRNVMEQAVLLAVGNRISIADLNLRTPPVLMAAPPVDQAPTLDTMERDLIVQALGRVGGNVTLAARALGISRDTLRYRMEKHDLKRGDFS